MTTGDAPADGGRVREAAWAALATVRDPELDRPVTDLGFVDDLTVDGAGRARVRLRLPTFVCAPNFAYMMAADAHDALAATPGVTAVDVRLVDHLAADTINAGVATGRGFADTFPGLADGDLRDLRATFARKAHLAAQERLARRLLRDGWDAGDLAGLRLSDVEASAELDRLIRRRADLGLPTGGNAPVFTGHAGEPIPADRLATHLRRARTTRIAIDGNTHWCQSLLTTRYGTT